MVLASWPLTIRSLVIALGAAALPVMAHFAAVRAHSLEFLSLLRGELAANRQQEARIGLFKLCPGLRHLIDLGQDPGLIGLVVVHQRLHRQLSLLKAGTQVDQLLPVQR